MSVCPHEEVLIYVSRNAAAAETRGEMGNIIKQPMKGQRWSDESGRRVQSPADLLPIASLQDQRSEGRGSVSS